MVHPLRRSCLLTLLLGGCGLGAPLIPGQGSSSSTASLNLQYDNQFDQQGDDVGGAKLPTTVTVLWHGELTNTTDGPQTFDLPKDATGILTDPWNTNATGGSVLVPNLGPGTWNVSLTVNGVPIGTCPIPLVAGQTASMTFVKKPDDTFGACD
jgi:hypothetical protein